MKKSILFSTDKQSGFTLVEMLIATSVFSLALLLVSVSFIEISRLYRHGITLRRVQQSSRFIVDDLNRQARPAYGFSYSEPEATVKAKKLAFTGVNSAIKTAICAYETGDHAYDIRKFQNEDGACNLWFDNSAVSQSIGEGESLLEPGIEYLSFDVLPIDDGKSARVSIVLGPQNSRVAFEDGGNADLLDGQQCDPTSNGRQFCAVIAFDTVVTARGGE